MVMISVKLDSEFVESVKHVAKMRHRSVPQQIIHFTLIGKAMEFSGDKCYREVLMAQEIPKIK